MSNLLGGTTFIHNGIEHDYCFVSSILSMIPVCDEIVVVDAGSTDQTRVALDSLAVRYPAIRIIDAEWKPAPHDRKTNTDWTKDLAELARKSITAPMNLYIQADEVLHENDYEGIRNAARSFRSWEFTRHNFWLDPWHYTPPGKICGHSICRLAPATVPCSWGSETLDPKGSLPTPLTIYHYGFLRKGEAFRKKSEVMHKNFMGTIDPVIYKVEKNGCGALADVLPAHERIEFKGTHPEIIKPWLLDRGFKV